MNAKAEDQAKAPALDDARTDKEKLTDIGLSDEEAAALGEKDDDTAADKGKTGKDAGKPKEEDDADKEKVEADAEAAAAAAEADETPAKAKVPDHFTPIAETLSPEELEAINTDLAEIKQQFDDGDIDYEVYTDKRLELEKAIWHHEQAEMQNVNAIEQRWTWEREWYIQSNPELENSQVIYGAFAAQVNALLADDEFSTAPGFDILTEAHKRVAAEVTSLAGPGGTAPAATPAADKQSADERAKNALAKAKAAEAGKRPPETLAGKPAAEANVDANKFAHLDSLEGEALQKAIDKLSPADLKEYEDYHE